MHRGTVHLLTGQKWLENKYNDPDVLPKFNKINVEGTIEAIEEYLRSGHRKIWLVTLFGSRGSEQKLPE